MYDKYQHYGAKEKTAGYLLPMAPYIIIISVLWMGVAGHTEFTIYPQEHQTTKNSINVDGLF